MKKLLLSVNFLLAFTVISVAQDPVKVAPESYKLQFENQWVRVLRVHYAPKAKVVLHDHSRFPAAYIYLNDAGPINFKHTGWEHPLLVRRPVKAKSFRLSPTTAHAETHEAENPGTTPSDFLRIEMKTLKQGEDLAHLRVPAETVAAGASLNKAHYENTKVLITRTVFQPGTSVTLGTARSGITAFLSNSNVDIDGKNATYAMGDTIWAEAGKAKKVLNTGKEPVELLTIEIKAPPANN